MPKSNTPIPDAELAELRRLHAAATPGEWRPGIAGSQRIYGTDGQGIESGMIVALHGTRNYRNKEYIAALHNAFPALMSRLEAAEREREEARKENDFMRLRLAESDRACVYCDLPKTEMGGCASGFPGCARADDLFHCDELTRRDEKQSFLDGAQALEALHWWFDEDHEPEREAVRSQREDAGVRWTSDQWLAAVLDAMEKEGKG